MGLARYLGTVAKRPPRENWNFSLWSPLCVGAGWKKCCFRKESERSPCCITIRSVYFIGILILISSSSRQPCLRFKCVASGKKYFLSFPPRILFPDDSPQICTWWRSKREKLDEQIFAICWRSSRFTTTRDRQHLIDWESSNAATEKSSTLCFSWRSVSLEFWWIIRLNLSSGETTTNENDGRDDDNKCVYWWRCFCEIVRKSNFSCRSWLPILHTSFFNSITSRRHHAIIVARTLEHDVGIVQFVESLDSRWRLRLNGKFDKHRWKNDDVKWWVVRSGGAAWTFTQLIKRESILFVKCT